MKSTFITWYPYCRRSDTIAATLGGSSHLIHYFEFKNPLHAPAKYVLQTFASLRTLRAERPAVVFVAVPPIFAAIPVYLWARWNRAKIVIDAHTGIFAHKRWTWLLPLTRRMFAAADTVIVTNDHLKEICESWGAVTVVIGDVPVAFCEAEAPEPCKGQRVVVVNTFSVDEPVEEVLAAAKRLPDVSFFVTGNLNNAPQGLVERAPANLSFTGFVSEQAYAGLLKAADAVVVLTTHDHTMQRGGYEAVAMEKPLVTSDWQILHETFARGTVHVKNTPEGISTGIVQALKDEASLSAEMKEYRKERRTLYAHRIEALKDTLGADDVAANDGLQTGTPRS